MIDSHAHIGSEDFFGEEEAVLERARVAGVTGWIEIGTTVADSVFAVDLAGRLDSVYATIGVHPNELHGIEEDGFAKLEELSVHPLVKAVGEVGLDFSRDGELSVQLSFLKRFVDLALNADLPMVFHVRSGHTINAHQELLSFLESLPVVPRGVIHTYSGDAIEAKRYLELGLYLSVSGVVTFKNAGPLLEVVKETSLDRLLIETDSPYLTPVPYRGQRNEPSYVRHVAEKIAEIKGVSLEEVDEVTTRNTKEFFRL